MIFAPGSVTMWVVSLFQLLIPLVIIGLLVVLVNGSSRRRTVGPAPAAPQALRPTLAQRLGELDALLAAGTITTAERDAARAKLLGAL